MAVLEVVFVIGLAVVLGLSLANTATSQHQQRQLEAAFYKLLDAHNGAIALIQLAAAAKVDAELARQYLDRQAKAFGASLEVDPDGDTFYRFPKLRRPDFS